MTIGIASPISVGAFDEYLDNVSKDLASGLSADYAPAVTTLAKEFLLAGHRLVIFTLDPKARQELVLNGDNLTIYVAPGQSSSKIKRLIDPFLGRNVRMVNKLFDKNKIELDVLSVHWTREYAIASRKYIDKIPVFVTVRDIIPYIIKTQKLNWRIYNWWIIYLMNEWVMRQKGFHFIANSEYTARSIQTYWGKKVPVIANPTLDKYFDIEYASEDTNNNFEISTISISQPNDRRKNIVTLLNAFKYVRRKYPNISLNLIGQGFVKENPIIREWEMEGLLQNVKLKGAMKHGDVLAVLAHSHLMVHPSLEETFGNTLIEAMAVGCPVIGGRNSGAVPFVLENGKAGYLCDVTSADKLAEAIMKVLDSPSERSRISKYAKKYCFDNFSSRNIANKYMKLFENISKISNEHL